MFPGSVPGSGAGKGGGAGGSIRESGGSMGQRGAVQEDEYFKRKDAECLQKMREQEAKEGKSENKDKS